MPPALSLLAPLAVICLLLGAAAVRGETLAELRSAARGGTYKSPGKEDLRTARALFERTLKGKDDVKTLTREWKALHFDLIAHREAGISFLVLRESAGRQTGRGFYAFRRDDPQPIALQAPHAWDDLHTGPIAARLLVESAVHAAAWNTLPRADVDLAHQPASYFSSFTAAFAAVHLDGVVVQLHGFARKGRKTKAALDCDLVVSGGTKKPAVWVLEAARQLKSKLSDTARLYPSEVSELGGTTNAQSALLHGSGHEGFLHLEMSLELRKRLLDESKSRKALIESITKAYQEERKRGVR